jgi:eukaryotic-like serine/threonine-protein kinase
VDGNVFFMRDGTLMVQPFDTGKLKLRGDPVPVAEHVGTAGSIGLFSVSPTGVLVYRSGDSATAGVFQATWFDRQGKPLGAFAPSNPDVAVTLSPDAARAASRDARSQAKGDIWILDSARGVRTRFTFRQSSGSGPVWSPDGTRIFFSAGNSPDTIYEKASTGAGDEKELLKRPGEVNIPDSASRDGRFLLYTSVNAPKTGNDLWILPLQDDAKPVLLLGTEFQENNAVLSPDGRWLAYRSNESGRAEIYVRPFLAPRSAAPSLGEGKWQVSRDGATNSLPHWREDGKELLFVGNNNAIIAVSVSGSGQAFQIGAAQTLFTAPTGAISWDATRDAQRILLTMTPGLRQQGSTPITVVLNWQADLKR